mgnify:CR=1 FL=1
MRTTHSDLFSYVRSSRAAVPYDAPRSSLLGAAQAGPGGLPRVTTALNRLGVKKAKPQRRPSLPPEPLPPPPVDAVAATALSPTRRDCVRISSNSTKKPHAAS